MTERNKAQAALAAAHEYINQAISMLGRENNTQSFVRICSRYHAALWRYKRAKASPLEANRKYEDFLSL